jgi:hypothetical protein
MWRVGLKRSEKECRDDKLSLLMGRTVLVRTTQRMTQSDARAKGLSLSGPLCTQTPPEGIVLSKDVGDLPSGLSQSNYDAMRALRLYRS